MKLNPNEVHIVNIRDLGIHGEGIGSIDSLTVFVDGALPYEVVEIRLKEVKANYAVGEILRFIKTSPDRVDPPCPVFKTCGGCQLMHFSYEETLKWKEKRVRDALLRIGGLSEVKVFPCERADNPFHYRNKIQLPLVEIKGRKMIGLYEKASHRVVDVEKCLIHNDFGERVYEEARRILLESHVPFYNGDKGLRHLFIRTATRRQEVLICLIGTMPLGKDEKVICKKLANIEGVKGVLYGQNKRKDNNLLPDTCTLIEGESFIEEEILGSRVRLSLRSFFQVNLSGAEAIYKKAFELAAIEETDRVLDAFCGIGVFALYLARKGAIVTGIEVVKEAIEDAKANAKENGISATFIVGKAEEEMANLPYQDVIFLNPPRKGCEISALESLLRTSPKRVIYTSCDPATLARDLKFLKSGGYSPYEAYPFDLFPQTSHVETVVLIKKSLS